MTSLPSDLALRITNALRARSAWIDSATHQEAFRLFNGFYEGLPGLTIDVYAQTLLISCPKALDLPADALQDLLLNALSWVDTVLYKTRAKGISAPCQHVLPYGDHPADQIMENGCLYAVDLTMNQDASFYLDTRDLRKWLIEHAAGWDVLNTFAYTGSLGVAALAGGANRVVQVDLNRKFLSLAEQSCVLNHFDPQRMKLYADDFFSAVAQLKRLRVLFDCVILDPPFFSTTPKGRVDLVEQGERLINKLRPLVKHDGYLVSINNALFLSGAAYKQILDNLCADGYLDLVEIIDVPPDCSGYAETICNLPPTAPTPFNHPTKIAILKVRRKE